jgi:uncharacterized protein (TIGR03086 family)
VSADRGVVGHHRTALAQFDSVVRQVGDDQWTLPTPCEDWSVRDLVHHVVGEALWAPPLLEGRTIAEVGDAFAGDLLGNDPLAVWASAHPAADKAADLDDIESRTVELSFGVTPAGEYLRQLTADYLIHAWDLATAIGADGALDADLVSVVGAWFAGQAEAYRSAGAIADAVVVGPTADAQRRLLAAFGRDALRAEVLAAVDRFDAAFGRCDVDAIMAAMTDDCVFESTSPPDGQRFVGAADVRAAWTDLFAGSAQTTFVTEDRIVAGDRVVSRWRYDWGDGHVRGIDVFRVRDKLVAEKASYVKG